MNPADPYGLIGQVLDGQFRVDRFVGEGGFSVVYRGHHIGLDEPIAIKCLKLPASLGSALVESFVRRFRDESRLHYRLSQGNLAIVRSIASGTTMSPSTSALVPFMVLEWLEGKSLAQDLDVRKQQGMRGRPLPEVIRLLDSAAQGLAYAHAQGVVHRDINPGNLFLATSREGTITKVLDFGVAKVISDHALELGPRAQTIGHIRIFAPAYGAPEQFDDTVGKVGPASDVYSFALIVLECMRDEPVREGEHIGEFAMTALDPNKKPSPRALGIPVGDAVEEAFARAVAMKPEDRPGDVGEFWGSLKNAMRRDMDSGRPPHAQAIAPRSWKPHAPAAGQPAITQPSANDRGVTADMPAPIVEVARPGSVAPPPVDATPSRMPRTQNQTVRMSSRPPMSAQPSQSGAAALGATPLTSTLMMDNVQRVLTPVPPTTRTGQAPEPSPMAHSLQYGTPPPPPGMPVMTPIPPQYGPPPAVAPHGSQPPPMARADVPTVVPPKRSNAAVIALLVFVMLVVAAAAGFGVYRVMTAKRSATSSSTPTAMIEPPPTLTSATIATAPPPPTPAPTATMIDLPSPLPSIPEPYVPPAPRSPSRAAGTPAPAPSSPSPSASASAPAPGSHRFDPTLARAALDIMDGVLASCRQPGGTTGAGTITVTFAPDGRVSRAIIDEPPYLGTPESICVASRFKQARVPAFEGDPGTVVYTFYVPK